MVKSLIFILSLALLSSCGTIDQKKISQAYVNKAVAEYKIKLPDQPDFCKDKVQGVQVKIGEKWRWINYRWEVVLENVNKERAACGQWYDDMRKSFEKGK